MVSIRNLERSYLFFYLVLALTTLALLQTSMAIARTGGGGTLARTEGDQGIARFDIILRLSIMALNSHANREPENVL
jgi:hypothetical protein